MKYTVGVFLICAVVVIVGFVLLHYKNKKELPPPLKRYRCGNCGWSGDNLKDHQEVLVIKAGKSVPCRPQFVRNRNLKAE
jgi:hypothetical protein